MNHSAANLVKMSCRQLNYLYRQHGKPPKSKTHFAVGAFEDFSTEAQIKGNEWAKAHSKGSMEMRGCVPLCGDLVFFVFDEIRVSLNDISLIEHKSPYIENWHDSPEGIQAMSRYFGKSMIQSALYRVLFELSDKILVPSIHSSETESINLNRHVPVSSVLEFCGAYYWLTVRRPAVLNFFVNKLLHSKDYNLSKQFDDRYKNREWNYFKDYISFEAVESP